MIGGSSARASEISLRGANTKAGSRAAPLALVLAPLRITNGMERLDEPEASATDSSPSLTLPARWLLSEIHIKQEYRG